MTAAERWPHLPMILAQVRGGPPGSRSVSVGVDWLIGVADTLSEMAAHIDAQDAQIQALTAEHDRLARILAVERGDESAAPEGWRQDGYGRWVRPGGPIFLDHVVPCPRPGERTLVGSGPWWKAYHDKLIRWPSALEAMEALEVSGG